MKRGEKQSRGIKFYQKETKAGWQDGNIVVVDILGPIMHLYFGRVPKSLYYRELVCLSLRNFLYNYSNLFLSMRGRGRRTRRVYHYCNRK